MRRLVWCGAWVLPIVSACGGATSTQLTGPESLRCQISFDGPVSIGADQTRATLQLQAARECAWSLSTNASWVQLSPRTGQGDAVIGITAAVNAATAARIATIQINDRTWTLTQFGSAPPPAPAPSVPVPAAPPPDPGGSPSPAPSASPQPQLSAPEPAAPAAPAFTPAPAPAPTQPSTPEPAPPPTPAPGPTPSNPAAPAPPDPPDGNGRGAGPPSGRGSSGPSDNQGGGRGRGG